MEQQLLQVRGARVHNLKNIDVDFPRGKLSVITGLSGSGKSSLAFDTIFAEGQRRYLETFSSYARNLMGILERPNVDKIDGLSPVIAISQKSVNRNPRSTVGTVTEIYDYLRLLYARAATAVSYVSGKPMVKYTIDKIISLILQKYDGRKIYILAPVVKNRKGHYKELFENLRKRGFLHARVDGELRELTFGMKVDRYVNHSIEVVIDRLKVAQKDEKRLQNTIETAFRQGEGQIMILDVETNEIGYYSKLLMDPETGLSYPEPAPHNFSFNSPGGACPRCKGLGFVSIIDRDKIMPDMSLSIAAGGILPLGKAKNSLIFWQLQAICEKYDCSLDTPLKDLPEEALQTIFDGTNERLPLRNETMSTNNYFNTFEGLVKYISLLQDEAAGAKAQRWAGQFFSRAACPECGGTRLNLISRHFMLDGKSIADAAAMDLRQLREWLGNLKKNVTAKQWAIAREIVKEIDSRLGFLLDVGLDYLSLNRPSATLSGGESQRIRLATQIASQLVNVLYILDEPSIGLHQRDNMRLLNSLKQLRDIGNTILVVEHDRDIMLQADYVVDIGPQAGRKGGYVVFSGTPKQLLASNTLTANYLNGKLQIEVPSKRRKGNGDLLTLTGCRGNNLKNVSVSFPLGTFICVVGVSGSGKSSLINGTLQPILSQRFYRSLTDPLPYDTITGIEHVDKVVTVDQAPLGRTARSNAATYTGVFTDIRNLFVSLPESKIRDYKPGRFSFNTKGGRCEVCKGNGYKTIEMHFLPDVLVPCEACGGKRYNQKTLEVKFKGKSIADVLDMTINQAVEFFQAVPSILQKLQTLKDVGLGYIKLGQPSSTLSGGECQRVKLAAELSKKDTGKTIYILDEPTTGLHFDDIKTLLAVLQRLVDRGNTVIVIEHNIDIIKCADHIIELGPDGGNAGGQVIATGTPEQVATVPNSPTAPYLRDLLTP